MGLIYPGIPEPIVDGFLRYFPIKYFIETGTYLGATASWAAGRFEKVFTIEKKEELWAISKNKFKAINNIDFLLGDSREQLNELVSKINSPALFWLDAHWSGGNTYGEGNECALLRELEVVNTIDQDCFILIDDARLFMFPPPHPYSPTQWPTIGEVLSLLNKAGRYSVIVDDVVISIPDSAKSKVMQIYQNLSTQLWEKHLAQIQTPRPESIISKLEKSVRAIVKCTGT